jgi:hypothetical protein
MLMLPRSVDDRLDRILGAKEIREISNVMICTINWWVTGILKNDEQSESI